MKCFNCKGEYKASDLFIKCEGTVMPVSEAKTYCKKCLLALFVIDAETVFSDYYKNAAVILGKKGGEITSEAKAKASRENGKKGGRPRKKKD